jgi:gluconolactonase
MIKANRLVVLIAMAFVHAALLAAESPVIAPGATLEKLADGYGFTEGPTSDPEGDVYFTDQPNNRILKWSSGGGVVTWKQPAGRANGMCFDRRGLLFACADEKMELWTLDENGTATVLVSEYAGQPLNGPNDVWIRPDGGLYFTDPFYKRPWWTHTQRPQDGQHVYYRSPDGKELKRVVEDFTQPNGIVGSWDGHTLFVADIGARKTYRFNIQPDGSLTSKALFCEMGSDGMTLDKAGNLYLTGRGVTVFNPAGQQIEHIDVPESWTANVCFGGADRRTLFITASKGFYGLKMKAEGMGPGK